MTNGFTTTGDGFIRMRAALNDMRNRVKQHATLNVGWDERAEYPENHVKVATVARVQEYGVVVPKGRGMIVIPPRPFIRPAIHQNGDEWVTMVRRDIESTDLSIDTILERLGIVIVGDIQLAIKAVFEPPLSPETIRRRLKKGHENMQTATKPLIDTGRMLGSIRSEVSTGPAPSGVSDSTTPSTPKPAPPDVVSPPTGQTRPKKSLWRRAVNFVKGVFGR